MAAGTRGMITGWKYLEGVNMKKGRDEITEELQ